MLITYGYIFYALRKRLRTIQLQEMAGGQFLGFGADLGNITTSAIETVIGIAPRNRNMISWEKPLLRKIEETAAEHASSLNDSEREQLATILECVQPSSSGSQELTTMDDDIERPPSVLLEAVTMKFSETASSSSILEVPRSMPSSSTNRRFSDALTTFQTKSRKKSVTISTTFQPLRRHSYQPQGSVIREHHKLKPQQQRRNMRRLSEMITEWERPSRSSLSHMYSFARRESVYIARKKLAGLKDWALDLLAKLKSKQGMAIRRETRATKLVATVMVVFLVCWLPFFTLNMVKVYKLIFNTWPTELEGLFHWFTALGYLNSSINFFIYAAINQKFRSSFRRLVGLQRKRDKTWMLPPKELERRRHARYGCGCGPFHKVKKTTLRKASSVGIIPRKFSVNKPEIIIDEVSMISPNNISISNGGNTTFRRSSDDCIRRSSSEVMGGVTFPSNYNSRRGSGMSNSSASLQLHDMHQISAQSSNDAEIFV
uniref:G-protein coupled receptors family 1 profile domain-containing protein n=1 Tax=Panagrolaimus davidi TaxID=227884 RepID=A0A914QKH1_9BILA